MDRNCRIWNKCKLLPIGGDARVFERLSYCVELIVGSGNNILLLLRCQLLCAGFQGQLEDPLLDNGIARDGDPAFFMKHVRNAAAARQVAVITGEDASDFSRGPVLVVGRSFDDHRHPTWSVTFIDYLVEM